MMVNAAWDGMSALIETIAAYFIPVKIYTFAHLKCAKTTYFCTHKRRLVGVLNVQRCKMGHPRRGCHFKSSPIPLH